MLFHVFKTVIFNLNKQIFFNKIINQNVLFKQFNRYSVISDIDRKLLDNHIQYLQKEYDSSKSTQNNKRLLELEPLMHILNNRSKLLDQLNSIKELAQENDEEMKKLVEEETKLYEIKIKNIEEELVELLIPANNTDLCDSIVLEINAGVGGQEAMLFAKELFDMYWHFAESKGWSCELADFDTTDIGGLRHASIFINGDEVYKFFQYEGGVHRVQRIPTTEKSGRVHTSTVSVVALPQPKDVDIQINEKDLRIDTKKASGAGGQHVNTTDSAVRILHIPTNTMVECQVDRSQIKNRALAMQKLKALLYEKQLNEQIATCEATRKLQVRSNFRNEKIRTYNYSQDRITDHRLQGSNIHNLKVFLEGGEPLETLINKLHISSRKKLLMDIMSCANKTA